MYHIRLRTPFSGTEPRLALSDELPELTPDEVRRACLQIQAGWDKAERHLRAHFRPPWTDLLSNRPNA